MAFWAGAGAGAGGPGADGPGADGPGSDGPASAIGGGGAERSIVSPRRLSGKKKETAASSCRNT